MVLISNAVKLFRTRLDRLEQFFGAGGAFWLASPASFMMGKQCVSMAFKFSGRIA
jgi:hypothetical protein